MNTQDIGYVMPADRLVLRVAAGDAKGEDGKAYELSNSTSGQPLVRSRQTGKWFGLSWQQIIEFAIAAGIDRPDAGVGESS